MKDLHGKNLKNIFTDLELEGLPCEPDDIPMGINLTTQDVHFLQNGQLEIDGAIIPFNKHCFNQQGISNYS